ncbi:multi-sensor hybrid histidine kinase [Planoprotostelium fungivorum]|uniref:Multi-sensor hybrid histidine kinase n=1 Tax=Planoprotostelium fungivorum TaxID=1890364 RepID=A0A2P6N318_9EUKA|nr:multi-sensor hybrid histidine kinase [Planoprotostelium fungivorum]
MSFLDALKSATMSAQQAKKGAAVVISPPKPTNERERLKTLQEMSILDTEQEEVFDAMIRAVKNHLNVPIVLISLVDENRQWFKACIGLDVSETSRDVAFCAYAILSGTTDLLLIPDARCDERFRDNPLVTGPPHIRFYAGAPLISTEGYALGTLCVIDGTPRILKDTDITFLQDCASVVIRAMEMRSKNESLTHQIEYSHEDLTTVVQDRDKLMSIVNNFQEGFVMWNKQQQIVFVNQGFTNITGMQKEEAMKLMGPDLFICSKSDPDTARALQRSFGAREACEVELVSQKADGMFYWNCLAVKPIFDERDGFTHYWGTLSDQSERKFIEEQANTLIHKQALT